MLFLLCWDNRHEKGLTFCCGLYVNNKWSRFITLMLSGTLSVVAQKKTKERNARHSQSLCCCDPLHASASHSLTRQEWRRWTANSYVSQTEVVGSRVTAEFFVEANCAPCAPLPNSLKVPSRIKEVSLFEIMREPKKKKKTESEKILIRRAGLPPECTLCTILEPLASFQRPNPDAWNLIVSVKKLQIKSRC